MFEAVVKIMEYDPELQQGLNGGKVDYIKYIRDEVRFRTVIRMDDDGGLSHREEEATTGMAEGSCCANNDNEGSMTLSNNNFTLESGKNFVPSSWLNDQGCLETFPPRDKVDGMFAARIRKK